MNDPITGYELHRVETPTGRVIGDSTCQYESLTVAALCLLTAQGRRCWGYGETVGEATFTRDAWYFEAMVPLSELKAAFERDWWPRLKGRSPFELRHARVFHNTKLSYLDMAARMAIWDAMAQQADLPLYRFLGGAPGSNKVRTYGSLLDYPLSEEDAVALTRRHRARGLFAIKVKVGAPELARDLKRIHAVIAAAGPGVEITIDANQNWACDQAIAAIRAIQGEGVRLGYVEDPLPVEDLDGFARLQASVDVDIIGHDYFTHPRQARRFLERKALRRLRAGSQVDHALYQAELSDEFGVPLVFGNSMFEFNVHAACAMPNVDRLEFSDLGWNGLMREPIRVEKGVSYAPDVPGHGLDPIPDVLREWSRPYLKTVDTTKPVVYPSPYEPFRGAIGGSESLQQRGRSR
jgi:L-alanine-DL-glutamate epimerase-like enolase superfamily enzyme